MSNGSEGSVYRPVVLAPWNLQSRLASPQPLCWLLEYRSGPCDDRLWRSRTVGISPAFAAKVWRRDLRRVIFTTRYPSKLQVRRCTSRPTFYPRGGTAEPRAHPHVCRGQPKHSCIITSTHSAHPGPLPVPSTRARMCPARALTGAPGAWLCTRSRAWLATPGIQGDGVWRYQHVPGEFVAVPPGSSTQCCSTWHSFVNLVTIVY